MKHFIYLFIIPMVILPFINCGGGGEEATLKQIYQEYHNLLQKEDIPALKKYISSQRQEELLEEGANQKIQLIKGLMPTDIKVKKAKISGDTAVLEVEGKLKDQRVTGTVDFLKEGGEWKVHKENWQITIEMGSEDVGSFDYSGDVRPFLQDPRQLPQVQQVITGHQGEVTTLAFTPDNQFLVSASYGDYSIRVWDPLTGEEHSNARTGNRVSSMAIIPDGSGILTADAYNNIILWPLTGGTIGSPQTLLSDAGDAVAISPDGKIIAATGWKRPIGLWDMQTLKKIDTIGSSGTHRVLRFSRAGDLLVGGGDGATYSIWDTKKWREKTYTINKVMKDSGITAIDISRNGAYMASGHSDSSIVIFDLEKRRELHNFYVTDAATLDVKFSPDNRILATAHYDKKIYLWEVKTAERLGVLARHTGAVKCLAFSGDGSMLASGGEDRQIITWKSGAAQMPVTDKPVPGPDDAVVPKAAEPSGPGVQTVKRSGQLNLIKYPDARQFTQYWQTKGEVSLEADAEEEDNYNFAIRYSGMVWQDVPVYAEGRYALLISWASSERVNPDGDQTGLPYLYGYMLNISDRNKINEYLQVQQMMLNTDTVNEWKIIYGIFQVPPETGAIRLFLQQADGRLPQNGSAARFDEPGIFLFDTQEQAETFAKNY
jgi:WD40 repeat protein